MSELSAHLDAILKLFAESGQFVPCDAHVLESGKAELVKFRGNPIRFLPRMFDGEWAVLGQHPDEGNARVLRVIVGEDGVARAILRQGPALFIYPAI